MTRRAATWLVLAALLLGAAPVAAQTPGPPVTIVAPAPGAVVDGSAVPVVLAVAGPTPAPAPSGTAPIFHVTLDGAEVLQTAETRFTLMGVPSGAHHLGVSLGDAPDAPSAEVAFTARAVAPATGASWYLAGAVALAAVVIFGGLLALWLLWVRPSRMEALYDEPAPPDAPPPAAGN